MELGAGEPRMAGSEVPGASAVQISGWNLLMGSNTGDFPQSGVPPILGGTPFLDTGTHAYQCQDESMIVYKRTAVTITFDVAQVAR